MIFMQGMMLIGLSVCIIDHLHLIRVLAVLALMYLVEYSAAMYVM